MFFFVAVIVALLIVWIFHPFIIVPENHVAIVEKFGKYDRTVPSGIQWYVPLVETIKTVKWTRTIEDKQNTSQETVSIRYFNTFTETIFDPPAFNCVTRDKIQVNINVIVFYRIKDPKSAVYAVEDLFQAMQQMIATSVRASCMAHTLEELISDKDIPRRGVLVQFEKYNISTSWGLQITKLEIQDINFHKKISEANQEMIIAKQQAQARIISEKTIRECKMMEVETAQKVELLEAETQSRKKAMETETQCNNIEREAHAKAEANRIALESEQQRISMLLSTDIGKEYLMTELYGKALQSLGQGSNKMIVPVNFEKFFGPMTTHVVDFQSK